MGYGALAQLGERRLCKPEVTGSIPVRSIRITVQMPIFVYSRGDTVALLQAAQQAPRKKCPGTAISLVRASSTVPKEAMRGDTTSGLSLTPERERPVRLALIA